jgi:uncharacterized protein YcfL
VQVWIGGGLQDSPSVGNGQSQSFSYPVNNGAVKLVSSNLRPLLASEQVLYAVDGLTTSFSEMLGLPQEQVDTRYWLPWYNNKDLDTQLRFGNVSNTSATVRIWIGGQEMTTGCRPSNSPYQLAAGASLRVSCGGVNNGPVEIESTQQIVAAERVIYKAAGGMPLSFSEMLALPNQQLDNVYWLPWYNNKDLDTQLRFGNVSSSAATVRVWIGGQEISQCNPTNVVYPYVLGAGQSLRVSCAGLNNGPVKIESTGGQLVAAERVIYKVNGVPTSFSEMLALPQGQVDRRYWLPWYDNAQPTVLDMQLRFGNVSSSAATVHVWMGGVEMADSPFVLGVGGSLRRSFGVRGGPVEVVSDQPIVVAERVIAKANGVPTSFSEMLGLPNQQVDTLYWLPWYNNIDLQTQLRLAVP